jgi:hypothetical protein
MAGNAGRSGHNHFRGYNRTSCRVLAESAHTWIADIAVLGWHVRFVPILLKKSFRGGDRKFLEPLMRLTRRREGPNRFIQNRSRTSVVALKSDAAAEKSEDRLSRDF